MASKRLRFHSDVVYREETIYRAGEIAEVENSSGFADKWIRRGVAIELPAIPPSMSAAFPAKQEVQKIYSKKKKKDTKEESIDL